MPRKLPLILVVALFLLNWSASSARSLDDYRGATLPGKGVSSKVTVTEPPNFLVCVHRANNMWFSVTNFGCFGSLIGAYLDCETHTAAPSCEFPAGTEQNYLWIGALWIGAKVGPDTLVSTGHDGWHDNWEMWPCSGPECGLVKLSNRPSDPSYSDSAKSDLDFIAEYTDTLDDRQWTGTDWQGRIHLPLNVAITQRSYSWGADYAQDFVLIDYDIANTGQENLESVYLGIYVDAEAGHLSRYAYCHLDDLCGFRETYPSKAGREFIDTISLAWIADDNGDPGDEGTYDFASVRSVTGVKVMRKPVENLKVSFNWWISNQSTAFDWGPMMEAARRSFGTGGQGTPEGDAAKYYLMANGEHDYDQIYAGRSFVDDGWLPPNPSVEEIALGGDTRFVLSMGPFDLPVDQSLPFTIAYVAGEKFHSTPQNFRDYMLREYNPEQYYETLNFDDIAENSVWAGWVYDNPGVDSDGDGSAGLFWLIEDTLPNGEIVIDTFYYAGDGVPDFRAATAPPPPVIRFATTRGMVQLRWNGLDTETSIDPFTRVRDFEGYRVFMGRLNRVDEFALIASHDIEDFSRLVWNSERSRWDNFGSPLTVGDLAELYGADFDPTKYPCGLDSVGLIEDSMSYCFDPVDWNQTIDGWDDGGTVTGDQGFVKRFAEDIAEGLVTPDIDRKDTLTSNNWLKDIDPLTGDSVYYHKYYEYEFVMDDLLPSVPWYFAVTAFDFGDAAFNIAPLETSPLANSVETWAINDASYVAEQGLKVIAYPNPYIGDGRYAAARYEDPNRSGFLDHERRIHFLNLPHSCTIRIFTISGDFVRELIHPGPFTQADSKLVWNVRSKNNELVTSGIYLFVVESELGNQIGKIVIVM